MVEISASDPGGGGLGGCFASPYSEQASLGVERQLARDFSLEIGGMFVRTLKLPRARDANLLPAPVDPTLGIPVWSSPASFVDPLLAERNVFESTARAWYRSEEHTSELQSL